MNRKKENDDKWVPDWKKVSRLISAICWFEVHFNKVKNKEKFLKIISEQVLKKKVLLDLPLTLNLSKNARKVSK